MSKELPYFRFTVSEWLNGDISMETMEDQGVFICICAFYWFKDCSLALAKLKQKFKGAEASLNRLLDSGILKVDENDNIIIDFLDEQFIKLSELHNIRSKAGRKGGLSKAKARLKQNPSYKDKDKDNNKDREYIEKGFLKIFNRWLQYKKDKKQTYKNEDSIEMAYNKLYKLSGGNLKEATEIVEQALANNWAGLFQLKGSPKNVPKRLGDSADEFYKH